MQHISLLACYLALIVGQQIKSQFKHIVHPKTHEGEVTFLLIQDSSLGPNLESPRTTNPSPHVKNAWVAGHFSYFSYVRVKWSCRDDFLPCFFLSHTASFCLFLSTKAFKWASGPPHLHPWTLLTVVASTTRVKESLPFLFFWKSGRVVEQYNGMSMKVMYSSSLGEREEVGPWAAERCHTVNVRMSVLASAHSPLSCGACVFPSPFSIVLVTLLTLVKYELFMQCTTAEQKV